MTGGPDPFEALAERIGHPFAEPDLLREALTHPSVNPGDRGPAPFANQRLEFLGDRVLGLVIAEWLLDRFPDEPEGALARRHTALVRAEALAEVAGAVELGRYLAMAPGEAEGGGRANAATLANACEAVIGALFRDGGLDAARAFVRREWAGALERDARPPQDPKTRLQEWAQGRGLPLPHYEIVSRSGPDHQPLFQVQVSVQGHDAVSASGASKRTAEREAASRLLATVDAANDA
jgi:ribonuclease-3